MYQMGYIILRIFQLDTSNQLELLIRNKNESIFVVFTHHNIKLVFILTVFWLANRSLNLAHLKKNNLVQSKETLI